MENTLSDPLSSQRQELENLQTHVARLQSQANELAALLAHGSAALPHLAALHTALAAELAATQHHVAAALLGADAIGRLAESRRQEAYYFRMLQTVSAAVSSTLDLRTLLNLLMDNVITVTKAERGYVVLRDAATGTQTVTVARGIEHGAIEEEAFAISRGLVAQVATTGVPIVTTNAQSDPRFAAMESVRNYQLRSIMCAPLVLRGAVSGVVYVDNRMRGGLFSEPDLELLSSIANQAALAIDNARVFGYLANVLASIASGVLTIDPDGTITTCNQSAATIFGVQAAEVLNQPYAEAFGSLASTTLPALIEQVLGGGPPVLLHEAAVLLPRRGEAVLLLSVTRVTGATGEPVGIVMVMEDVTQERRLQRFVAPTVVEQLRVATESPQLGGELREITVLFGDVQGYTMLAEQMPPEALLNLLNAHLSLAATTIMAPEHGGTLDKYIGDAVMGLFNTPNDQADHAWRAVQAAWAMQQRLRVFQQTLPPEHHMRFRIGVNTGPAVVGHIGSENLMNFTAIGDAVNVAKRLQELARTGQIMLSEATYTALDPALRPRLTVRPLGFIALKGRAAEVPAYELLDLIV